MANVYPVSVVNRYVQQLLSLDPVLSSIWVSGEVSNCKRTMSGHIYLTLKDEKAAINAVIFASDARSLTFFPHDGDKVEALGHISLYEKTGAYQLYIRTMKKQGQGSLYEAFEELKAKLEKEGLFDPAHKKSIPAYPRRIGIVTSRTGAVVHDIENVAKRRDPGVRLVLYPAVVQGAEAAPTIVEGIRALDKISDIDVIIVGRGGGSLEDLWPFNEESVARAIYEAKTPIISAVGHETDFTIADFAADLRAPTPSAAAELAVPDLMQVVRTLSDLSCKRQLALKRRLQLRRAQADAASQKLKAHDPLHQIQNVSLEMDQLAQRRNTAIQNRYTMLSMKVDHLSNKLKLVSPMHPLSKGYAFVTDKDGDVVTKAKSFHAGDIMQVAMADGRILSTVDEVK